MTHFFSGKELIKLNLRITLIICLLSSTHWIQDVAHLHKKVIKSLTNTQKQRKRSPSLAQEETTKGPLDRQRTFTKQMSFA